MFPNWRQWSQKKIKKQTKNLNSQVFQKPDDPGVYLLMTTQKKDEHPANM